MSVITFSPWYLCVCADLTPQRLQAICYSVYIARGESVVWLIGEWISLKLVSAPSAIDNFGNAGSTCLLGEGEGERQKEERQSFHTVYSWRYQSRERNTNITACSIKWRNFQILDKILLGSCDVNRIAFLWRVCCLLAALSSPLTSSILGHCHAV